VVSERPVDQRGQEWLYVVGDMEDAAGKVVTEAALAAARGERGAAVELLQRVTDAAVLATPTVLALKRHLQMW
jgi:hypothetical protein